MRIIDADALTRQIATTIEDSCMNGLWKQGMNYALGLVKAQPTIQPEPHWIPVTERLLEKDGNYLVSGKWGSGKESVGDCEFEDGYFQVAWNFDVLAWRELPEPYKGVIE